MVSALWCEDVGGSGMKIVICFKNGFNLTVTCEEFSLTKNGLGDYTGYEIKGITDNKPLYVNWSDITCIYRVMEGDAG